MLTTAFLAPALISAWIVIGSPPEFNRHYFDIVGSYIEVFALGSLTGIVPLGGYLYGMFSDVLFSPRGYPVRFNRQRREVCYIDKKTHRVLIVPWESFVAWVSNTQGITTYGATRQYTFGMGLEDEELDTVQFLLLSQASDAHALGMWASIRNYMEEGQLVDVPNPMLQALGLIPTGDRLKPYEGLHTFYIELDDARDRCGMVDDGANLTAKQRAHYGFPKRTPWPLRFWYLRRVLVFWKMPYLLAEWSHRKARPTLPEQVQQWSQPLPKQQWATPSSALVIANQKVKTAMDQYGVTFVEACKAAGLH